MTFRIAVVILMLAAYQAPSFADDEQNSSPQLPLLEVLNAVGKKTENVFLVDRRVHPDVVLGAAVAKRMDYATLLVVLRNNGLAAVKDSGSISIIKVSNAHAPGMVPMLRPLMPQQGHLAAHAESNTMTIVDRYDNLKRIVTLIRKMDAEAKQQ